MSTSASIQNGDSSLAQAKKPPKSRKRSRLEVQIGTNEREPKRCHLSRLPFELLAEILILTESPQWVLAVSRCSKFFCTTLLYPASVFIWKNTRKACKPEPLPSPSPNFTESAYAAFVFDQGVCEICKVPTDSKYASYALRLRLCHSAKCRKAFKDNAQYASRGDEFQNKLMLLVPVIEAELYFFTGLLQSSTVWPDSSCICRSEDWNAELQKYAAVVPAEISTEEYFAGCASRVTRMSKWMMFSLSLFQWSLKRQQDLLNVKLINETIGKSNATQMGYDFWDMMNSTSYGTLIRHRTKLHEEICLTDYSLLASTVNSELVNLAERRRRAMQEKTYHLHRKTIAKHYSRLRSKGAIKAMPSLSTFRKLPIISALQSSMMDYNGLEAHLKTPLVHEAVATQINDWTREAKKLLGATLGYPDWRNASPYVLHPVDRLVARFQCKTCNRVALRYQEDECLDFAGACAHECPTTKRPLKEWSADQFIKDDKAIAVMSKLLNLCGIDVEREESRLEVEILDTRILCTSCKPAIIMGPQSILGHSHRHEDMQITLLPQSEATALLTYPFEFGLAQKLMGPEYSAKKLQELKAYGCRHCVMRSPQLSTSKEFEKPMPNLFTFHGLRSHVKAKHEIDHLRDEDFFRSEPLTGNSARPIRVNTKHQAQKSQNNTSVPRYNRRILSLS